MKSHASLQRFVDAQSSVYEQALNEVRRGRKVTHWMWYIFPQIAGLGVSETSRYYALKDLAEAKAYLEHPVLGPRLISISAALMSLPSDDAYSIFGSPDDMKLKSCMTLFSQIPGADPVFENVLAKYFNGERDIATLNKI